ncbi:forkhead box Q2 [Aulostomus maculatus]
MTMEDKSSCTGSRERLGLSFTIDYLLFNKGVKGSKEEPTGSRTMAQTANNMLDHQNRKAREVGIHSEVQEKQLQSNPDKSADKPNQSYIALISKAILASEHKKLLLCDIYQWIMDHFPYFKSKDKNWRNSVRHNLSLNDCFIKAGRSENGKGHFWAIHPSNYQDFSNGDYHCRRARRRVRRVAGQLPLTPMISPYHHALTNPHRTTCWCCPQAQTLPLPCLAPRLYWPWPSVGLHPLHPGLHASVP